MADALLRGDIPDEVETFVVEWPDSCKSKFVDPPQFDESKGTFVFEDFMDFCRTNRRPARHVATFLLAKLCTIGRLDQDKFVLEGQFSPEYFQEILQEYISKYVICQACQSTQTIFKYIATFTLLQCRQCGDNRRATHIGWHDGRWCFIPWT